MSDEGFFDPVLATDRKSDFPDAFNLAMGDARKRQVVTKTAAYTASADDDVILVSLAVSSVTITLPDAVAFYDSTRGGHCFTVALTTAASGRTCTVDPGTTGQTIDEQATVTLTDARDSITVVSNGTNWFSITRFGIS